MEKIQKYNNIKDLYRAYAHHNLTEKLKTLSEEELDYFIDSMLRDDIIGDRVSVFDALNNEKEYRISDEALAKRR